MLNHVKPVEKCKKCTKCKKCKKCASRQGHTIYIQWQSAFLGPCRHYLAFDFGHRGAHQSRKSKSVISFVEDDFWLPAFLNRIQHKHSGMQAQLCVFLNIKCQHLPSKSFLGLSFCSEKDRPISQCGDLQLGDQCLWKSEVPNQKALTMHVGLWKRCMVETNPPDKRWCLGRGSTVAARH